jgi:hypothetical protein
MENEIIINEINLLSGLYFYDLSSEDENAIKGSFVVK